MAQDYERERASGLPSEDCSTVSMFCESSKVVTSPDPDAEHTSVFDFHADESLYDRNLVEISNSKEHPIKPISSSVVTEEKVVPEDDSGDLELGGFFTDDAVSNDALSPQIVELQKKEKLREFCSAKNLEKLEGIWKKVLIVK